MTDSRLVDQELVVHVFAPIDGPHSARADQQIREIWARCHQRLGTIEPILGTDLPTMLPADVRESSEGALAAKQDLASDYQVIVRRHHDVLNLSMVFAAPLDTPSRRLRIGSASPPGWIEFSRWWDELAADGTDALLGVVRVYQAKVSEGLVELLTPLASGVRAMLPSAEEDPDWLDRGEVRPGGFAVWELSPDDARVERRLMVIAPEGQDPELSAWTWSRGDVAMPPLARYLMHAAKLRFHARIRGNDTQITMLRQQVADRAARVKRALQASAVPSEERGGALRDLQIEEAELVLVSADLRDMRRAVDIAVDNMKANLTQPLPADRGLADWLPRQLADDAENLDTARQRATQIGVVVLSHGSDGPQPSSESLPSRSPGRGMRSPQASGGRPARIELRVGFAVDVAGYSLRTSPAKASVQERLAALVHKVLDDLDLRLEHTDHQGTGDGMNVFLPATVEVHRAVPRLIRAWHELLAADNQMFKDHLRLRMAMHVGPIGLAAIGFTGTTIVEVSRLVDSDVLRQALLDHPQTDIAILVSDQLYHFVVDEGYPGLNAHQFQRQHIEVKGFRTDAWLWVAS